MRTALGSLYLALLAGGIFAGPVGAAMPDWRTVTADELAMTGEPNAPGAAAIILYLEVNRDDAIRREYRYQQIKVLSEEGRSYGDIQLSYDKRRESLKDIEARTIRRDGTIVPFTGTITEKPLASGSDRKLMEKSLALTGVEVGSIVEVRFARHTSGLYDTRWLLANNLFTREAHYAFRGSQSVRYGAPRGLPPGTAPIAKGRGGLLTLDTRNVAAFEAEEFSPPSEEIQYRLDFIYSWDWDRPAKEPEKFWKRYAEEQGSNTENYLTTDGSLKSVVAALAPANDPPEARLRKLYETCAALRNKSYEPQRSEEEIDRDDEASPVSARDVWKRQYGWSGQINLLFMAMARLAGFDAAEVWVSDRWETFFDPKQMDPGPLDMRLVHVKLAGKDLYLSPGTKFLPFGSLPWTRTAQQGLRIEHRKFSWVTIPVQEPEQSRTRREARLALLPDGSLKGSVKVTQTGQEAMWRRNRENNEDAAHRRKFLETDLSEVISDASIVKVVSDPDWNGTGDFVVEYELTIPGRVLRTGNRQMMPLALFVAGTNSAFKRAERKNPVYIWYPYIAEEDVHIDLPSGWKVGELPTGEAIDLKRATYAIEALKLAGTSESVRVRRRLRMNIMMVPANVYEPIHRFYQTMRSGDEQQLVFVGAAR
jgi:Domain of Unknown Function with PDB structure (DUF3857)